MQRRWNRLGQFTNNNLRAKALVLKKFEFDKLKVVVSLSKSVELTKNARAVKICCCSYVFRVYYYLYKHDGTIFEINLSCVSFAQHSRIFLGGSSSLFHNQNDSAKLHSVFEIPLFAVPTKVALLFIGKAFCCLPSHPKLVYST